MKEIDKKLIETINRYVTSGIDQQVDYEKFYLYSLITYSTAIEGSTVTEVENQLLFDEGIAAIKEYPKYTYDEYAKLLNIGHATVARHIKKLNGTVIQRIGSDKDGYWEFIKD